MDKRLTVPRKGYGTHMGTPGGQGASGAGGRERPADPPAFERFGPEHPAGGVLLSVPHAGRHYAASLLIRSRVPEEALHRLEDRHADQLIAGLVARGVPALVARVPRAVIDLNRDPRDIDPRGVAGIPRNRPLIQSPKQRGGLGLFPYSLPRIGDLWRGAMAWEEALGRIETIHEPYHAALARELAAMRQRHGAALLVDVHSMPPLPPGFAEPRPDIVIGDRFGAGAAPRFAAAAGAAARALGFVAAHNQPYAGSYVIERHGRPVSDRHAVQIEISRDLYLDERLEEPGEGLERVRGVLLAMVEAMAAEALGGGCALAAE